MSGTAVSVVQIAGPLYRVSFTKLSATGSSQLTGIAKYPGQSPRAFKVTGFDIRYITGGTLPPYQSVTSDTVYDAVGFPAYLRFNTDDCMEAGSLSFLGADGLSIFATFQKDSDAAIGTLFSQGEVATAGSTRVLAPGAATEATVASVYKGASQTATATSAAQAVKRLTSASIIRARPTQEVIQTTSTDGRAVIGASFLSDRACIGAQVGVTTARSQYFNGRLYGLVVRAAYTDPVTAEGVRAFLKDACKGD